MSSADNKASKYAEQLILDQRDRIALLSDVVAAARAAMAEVRSFNHNGEKTAIFRYNHLYLLDDLRAALSKLDEEASDG